jgi:hypothetical protein
MRGPEGKIQDAVIRYAREVHNALCIKNEAGRYFVGGFLDYTIYPDKMRKRSAQVFVIEFKAPGGELTPKQAHHRKQLENRGHKVFVVDSVAKGRMIIEAECS